LQTPPTNKTIDVFYIKKIHTGMWEFLQEEDYLDDLVIYGRINVP